MADNIPDFTVKTPAIDSRAFADVLQRKQNAEDANMRADEQRRNDRLQRILQAIQGGQAIATNMMNLAQKRNQMQGEKELTGLMTTPVPTPPAPTAASTALPEAGNFSVQPSPEQNANYASLMDQRKRNLMAALVKANPQQVTEQMAQQMFAPPQKALAPEFQSKTVLYNGVPKEVAFNPRDMGFYDPITQEKLTGNIQPYSTMSPTAEIRKQALRDRQTENLGKDLNELSINSNSPAGISAKRSLYAKSGLNLINQAENQPGGADKRQVAELQMEVARVLTGTGVITNEQLNNLATRTARSKIANWQEWLTNEPTGTQQQAFVQRFKETLQRQAKFHGDELDKFKQKSMAKYTTFEKQAPEEFYASLEQAGYDVNKYKKTRKLVPSIDMNPPELDEISASLKPKRKPLNEIFGSK